MKNEIINPVEILDKDKIREKLLLTGKEQEELFLQARQVREDSCFANKVELRSVIELSNICSQRCNYCSIGHNNNDFFTLSQDEIVKRVKLLASVGRRTILLQSGENKSQFFVDSIANAINSALAEYHDLKFILCLGNLSNDQYQQLFEAGAQRYILKFEASNPVLHEFCRPSDTFKNRIKCIESLLDIGFKVGTGNIVGLPTQTLDDLVEDLILTTKYNFSMLSSTKFISSMNSTFKDYPAGDLDLTLNFIALLRILNPNVLIPSTSSLETENMNGQLKGLMAGCNTLTIHDGTPEKLKSKYHIYNKKRFTPSENHCQEVAKTANLIPSPYLL